MDCSDASQETEPLTKQKGVFSSSPAGRPPHPPHLHCATPGHPPHFPDSCPPHRDMPNWGREVEAEGEAQGGKKYH